jgi:hypothetical protein
MCSRWYTSDSTFSFVLKNKDFVFTPFVTCSSYSARSKIYAYLHPGRTQQKIITLTLHRKIRLRFSPLYFHCNTFFRGLNSLCEAAAKVVTILLSNQHWSPLKCEDLSHSEIKIFVPALERSVLASLSQVPVKNPQMLNLLGARFVLLGVWFVTHP